MVVVAARAKKKEVSMKEAIACLSLCIPLSFLSVLLFSIEHVAEEKGDSLLHEHHFSTLERRTLASARATKENKNRKNFFR